MKLKVKDRVEIISGYNYGRRGTITSIDKLRCWVTLDGKPVEENHIRKTRLIKIDTPRTKHLWEINHRYYCNDYNYLDSKYTHMYQSWSEFLAEWGDADKDYNLVFRWDWLMDDPLLYENDNHYRNGQLKMYFMLQRKGLFSVCLVKVCKADELEIIKYLEPRLKHLVNLWNPLKMGA